VSICSDSLSAVKALRAVRTSPLVHQCQKALNDVYPACGWSFFGSLDMLEYEVMNSPMGSQGAALL